MFLNDIYLPDNELCMAEIFKSEGYNTAYLGKWHLDGYGRLNNVIPERRQGFDYWKANECSHDYLNMPYYENNSPEMKYWEGYSPSKISKDAQDYLMAHAGSNVPFLLFVSMPTPHFPYGTAPKEYEELYAETEIKLNPNVPQDMQVRVRKSLKGYYAHCTATDKAIGDLFGKIKELGLLKNTIVVFTSDHGEMMGAHEVRPDAKQLVWDESIRVPFLISYPSIGKNKGAVINAPLTTPDILPSLLSLAHLKIPNTIEGEDLSRLIKSPDPTIDRAVLIMNVCPFSGEYKYQEYRGIRTRQYTYVCSPAGATMLFDDIKDPYQLNNLIGKSEYKTLQLELDGKLHKALKEIGDDNFQSREYYLKKWNLKLNDTNGHGVDVNGFLQGKGEVQSPVFER